MFWGDGRDLDLSSKPGARREVSVRPAPLADRPRPTVQTAPKAALRNLPSTVTSAVEEGGVLARFSTAGALQVLGAAAISLFLLGLVVNWLSVGDTWFAIIAFAALVLVANGIWVSAVLGMFNLFARKGRAVWISGGRLNAIDPFHGILSIPLADFERARFEPRLKSGKSYRRAIVLQRQGGGHKAFGVGHLDQPYANVLNRIAEAKAKNSPGS